jgi:hypothetical protein
MEKSCSQGDMEVQDLRWTSWDQIKDRINTKEYKRKTREKKGKSERDRGTCMFSYIPAAAGVLLCRQGMGPKARVLIGYSFNPVLLSERSSGNIHKGTSNVFRCMWTNLAWGDQASTLRVLRLVCQVIPPGKSCHICFRSLSRGDIEIKNVHALSLT